MLVSADRKFYLVRSRNPRATYRVLWYRLPGWNKRCKVDILIPGILNVPNVPPAHIRMVTRGSYHLPVMPPIPQLLLKLQGWTDHRASTRLDMRMKQYLDVRDIDALLEIMCGKGLRIDDTDAAWVPQTMIAAALDTVRTYVVIASPASMYNWRKLGFDISAELSRITSV
ncbi:hypothetical protein BD413DRAFT_593939 [Trametes elegans]|nr:hypothetical protein BD413DRAFT_593939 [Trametes elegans]